ncbi:hypothetical protein DPMN_088292 [Dreissena polymorpha]|uniref:Uncharacterized protein n=1 Tax=Dreissena polymorpha TaxID=45954 RepID=A0A9D4KVL6_DREPO|nr:hypothetical protein DPMN_088292 [Dreissena polymorpha]
MALVRSPFRKCATPPPSPPGSHVFQRTGNIFELNSYLGNKCSDQKKTALPTGGHVFSPIWTIFELVRDINKTNVLTKFHDWAKKCDFLTVHEPFLLYKYKENCPVPLAAMFFNGPEPHTNVLTKFHEDWTKNVTSRVFTCFHYIHIEKTAPARATKFHDNWAKIVTSRVFTSFELDRGIIGTNLTKFHEDLTRNVASRVFKRKTAPPTGDHVFQRTGTTFELTQHII